MSVFARKRWSMALMIGVAAIGLLSTMAMTTTPSVAAPAKARNITSVYTGASGRGGLDCNGFSPIQKASRDFDCTDIRGINGIDNANTWGGKFYDNGHYIGHDEPDVTFVSNAPGSGGNVLWKLTLGKDPTALPTDANPGSDVSHWFELSSAPWLSMALCDPNSDPLLPCTPNSDANAPATPAAPVPAGVYPGAGSAFMEMQFYPPGFAPFVDSVSCDNTHWCAAMTIDSLECTENFNVCNTNCEEPVNAAFISTNGIPDEPPNPQAYPDNQFPGANTMLMNPGDRVTVQIGDAPVPGELGQDALKITVTDLTNGQRGWMQASAQNGFQNTSIADCSGTPFNFEPEYNTASTANIIPWAALQTDISTEFETGHWESCTSLSGPIANPIDPNDGSTLYGHCNGPYETAGGAEGPETSDALCWNAGATHPGYAGPGTTTPPDLTTGCLDNLEQNGDLDFDGSPYWSEWPVASHPTGRYPASFVESMPLTRTDGNLLETYPDYFIQTDLALSESSCTFGNLSGCTIPPSGPGNFYPYWSELDRSGQCYWEFGNVSSGVDDLGKDAQYGTNLFSAIGYPEFEEALQPNTCPATPPTG